MELEPDLQPLQLDRLRTQVQTTIVGKHWHYAPTLDSTNAVAKQRAQDGAKEGLVVLCEQQRAGRGRGSHSWISPQGGLWFSFLLRPQDAPLAVLRYTALTAAAVAVAVEEQTGQQLSIHWPNDLMIGERKIGGVLCEVATLRSALSYVVIGVGLNVNNPAADFPEELRDRATSLVDVLGKTFDRERLLAAILETVELLIYDRSEQGFLRYRSRLSTLGQRVLIEEEGEEPLEGYAVDIDESGQLLITSEEGLHTVNHGHCRHLGKGQGQAVGQEKD